MFGNLFGRLIGGGTTQEETHHLRNGGKGPWAVTRMEATTFEYDWIVKGFSAIQGSCDYVDSPTFQAPDGQTAWHLKMRPRTKEDGVEWMGLHLYQATSSSSSPPKKKLNVRFEMSLKDRNLKLGNQCGGPTMKSCTFNEGSIWGFIKFIRFARLTDPSSPWLVEDTLRIHVTIWIDDAELKHESGRGLHQHQQASSSLLAQDLRQLRLNGEMTDVSLVTATKTFMAHKVVLAARSSVFSAMFQIAMREADSGRVEIPDFDEGTVQAMLEHMYGGVVAVAVDAEGIRASSLLQIADKYDLPGLKEEAGTHIVNSLTVETAADAFVLARAFNSTSLQYAVVHFMNLNKERVKKTDSFQALPKELLVELCFSSSESE